MWVPAGVFNHTLESQGGIVYAPISPQISASALHSRRPPLRWERCSTRPPPGTAAYTWDRRGRTGRRRRETLVERLKLVFYCGVCELAVSRAVWFTLGWVQSYRIVLCSNLSHLIASYFILSYCTCEDTYVSCTSVQGIMLIFIINIISYHIVSHHIVSYCIVL